jgi:hypothetical protein
VREAALLASIGLAIALPACRALGRLIESQLFGVRPMDAATIVAACGVLALAGRRDHRAQSGFGESVAGTAHRISEFAAPRRESPAPAGSAGVMERPRRDVPA